MRYELDVNGYICKVFFGCFSGTCTLYEGEVPVGYETLEEWATTANVRAYKIVDNNLVYDAAKDAELSEKWAKAGLIENYSRSEQIIGKWIDGKPLYRKTIECGAMTGVDLYVPCGVSNVDKIWIDQSSSFSIATDGASITLPFHNAHSANYSIECYITNAKQIQFYSPNQRFANAYVTLKYTKTTDEVTT